MSPAVRRLGHEPEELIGRLFVDFRAPEEGSVHRIALERVLAGETVLDYEVPVATGDGHAAVLSFNCAPLRNDVGEVVGATGTATDVTDRKQMEQALRAGRARLQGYIDSADDIIVTIDTGQRITSVNRTGLEVSGYSSDDVVGHRACDFVIPELRLRVEGQIARAFAGERLGEIVVTALAKGDRRITVRIRGGTVMEGREPVELVLVARQG